LTQFLIFLPVALVLTPLQASVEEFFFRGYLMQGIALKTRNAIIPIVLSSFLFMLPHLLNPEVKSGFFLSAAYYLIFGLFLAFITVKDNCLELALGVHVGNNLYNALFATYADGALPASSIFTIQKINPQYNLLSTLIVFALIYLFFFRRRKRETQRLGED
jgi:membrane protease YdiL (CAAX protease family)